MHIELAPHELNFLSAEWGGRFLQVQTRTIGVLTGAQSSITKSLSLLIIYWHWKRVIWHVERLLSMSMPRNQLVDPKSRSLKRFCSSALIC